MSWQVPSRPKPSGLPPQNFEAYFLFLLLSCCRSLFAHPFNWSSALAIREALDKRLATPYKAGLEAADSMRISAESFSRVLGVHFNTDRFGLA